MENNNNGHQPPNRDQENQDRGYERNNEQQHRHPVIHQESKRMLDTITK